MRRKTVIPYLVARYELVQVVAVTSPGDRAFLSPAAVGAAVASVALVKLVRYAARLQRRVAVKSVLH